MRILLVSANRERLPSPVVPIGVLYVAGAVRDAHDVRVVDLCFEADPHDALAGAIRAMRPELVGLGLRNLHDNSYTSSEPLLGYYESLVATIRAASRVPLVVGGAAVTLRPTSLLGRLEPDHLVLGEGEIAFRRIADQRARGEKPDRVVAAAAVMSRRRLAEQASDLDGAAPARDLLDPRYFEEDGTDVVQTKRGCAFQCTYCDYPDLEGRKVRVRDPALVAREMIACASRPGVSHVFFVDAVFNVPRSHALAICRELRAQGSRVPWICYVTPAGLDDELAASMAAAGCIGVEIGTDAGSAATLERLKKPFGTDDVVCAQRALRAYGILDCHTFILGTRGETAEQTEETLRFADALDPGVAVFMTAVEDREARTIGHSSRRNEILTLLDREARARPRWVVPELGIRFGARLTSVMRRRGVRGPTWLALAATRAIALGA